MRLVRFGAILVVSAMAGCGSSRPHTVSLPPPPAPAPVTNQRQLVETPPPAAMPEPPTPALKPGTEYTLAESEALTEQASPKGPPVEGEPNASQKAIGRMAAQTAPQGAAPQGTAPEAVSGQGTQKAPSAQTAGLPPAGGAGALPVTDAAHLVGLSQSDVTVLFGPPAESKDLPPSKVWTYHSPVCDMKLFFYPEVGRSTFRALTYQIDERGASDATHNACLSSLAKPRAG
jgi:hypothetical protein